MGEHITVEDSFDYVKKATEPLQQCIEELEADNLKLLKENTDFQFNDPHLKRKIELQAEIKRLRDAIGKISLYCSDLDIDDYDNPYEVRITIEAIQSEIKALKEGK